MIEIEKEACTGCCMCGEVCPANAIKYHISNGFKYPVVEVNKCIKCGLCIKRCPSLNPEQKPIKMPTVYAAWSNNINQRRECTSGGICYELSRYIISKGGYVAGVVWENGYKDAGYKLIDNVDDLTKITQTKYFQPQMNQIYSKVKELLLGNNTVLFIGTACTNAGLRKYLNKKYTTLYCIDFICRGYTSQIYHQKRVESLEKKYKSPIRNVQYKNKSKSWKSFGTLFDFENGQSLYINRYEDPYEYMLQNEDYNTRPSCFDCFYRDLPRYTDITVGDFWGINGISKEIEKDGISAVIVNSNKGADLFENIKEKITFEERGLWEISKGNHCLLHQLEAKGNACKFFEDLDSQSIDKIHRKYGKNHKMKIMVKKLIRAFKILTKCNLLEFINLNYLSGHVVRKRGKYLFPYRGTKFDFDTNAKIILNDNLYLNTFKHKGSREETLLHICNNGILEVNGRVRVASSSSIDILESAKVSLGSMDTNYGMVMVCGNRMILGNDLELGRNVTLYDSNFHPTSITTGKSGRPLIIEDHVWLCTGVTVAKGVTIGTGAICGINSTVIKNVKKNHMVMGNPAKVTMIDVRW